MMSCAAAPSFPACCWKAPACRNGLFGCVVGFGVNCLSSPTDAPYPTASLKNIGAEPADRAALFAALSDSVVAVRWRSGRAVENFAAIRAAWLENAGGIGARFAS